MRERGSSPSPRGLLKGAVAATAAASLANLAAADQADAELIAMGRELEALEAQERIADDASDRLYEEAARTCPAPSAALLAYSWRGDLLFRASGEGYRLNSEPYGALMQRSVSWRDMGASGDHYPEALLIADLKRWEDGRRAACDANGCAVVMADLDRIGRRWHVPVQSHRESACKDVGRGAGEAPGVGPLSSRRGGRPGRMDRRSRRQPSALWARVHD